MLVLAVGALATATVAPIVRVVMIRRGMFDVPNHRSSHSIPTPRGGGWACIAGVLAAVTVAHGKGPLPLGPVAGAVLLGVVGFADDTRDLHPAPRLAAQVAVGALVGGVTTGVWGALLGVLVFPIAVNVVNFMDGINGITALTLAVWGSTALLMGTRAEAPSLAVLGAATAGSALGFLPWNAPVARLFLGDVGSYFLGALVAGGLLLGWHGGVRMAVLTAPLCIYAADTAFTLIRRACKGERLLTAHREHVYQRLVSVSGLSHMASALVVAGSSAFVTVVWLAFGTILASILTALVVSLYLGSVRLLAAHAALLRSSGLA